MSALACLVAAALTISLGGCDREEVGAVLGAAKGLPKTEKRALIRRHIARVCPSPMTDAERDRAADYVLAHAVDLEALWIVGRLDQFDAESMVCRSAKAGA